MDQINTPNVKTKTVGCATQLFRNCGDGGDATIPGAQFMNGIMMEILTAICASCQVPMAFDENDPESFSQLWAAIQNGGGTGGVAPWSSGTTAGVVRGADDCCLYYANPEGDAPNNDPSEKTDDTDWFGCFASMGELLNHKISAKDCAKTVQVEDPCSEYEAVYLSTDSSGCGSYVTAGDLLTFVGAFGPDHSAASAGPVLLPLIPTDSSTFYTKAKLQDHYTAGTVDQALLDSTLMKCDSRTFPCDGEYRIRISNTLNTDWDLKGVSSYVVFIDGAPVLQTSGNLSFFGDFISTDGSYQQEQLINVTAGDHQICYYLVGAQGYSGNAAQAYVVNGSQPRLRITRVINSAD